MGCRILGGSDGAVMYDSVTGLTFGPLMEDEKEAKEFMEFIPGDPRQYSNKEIESFWKDFQRRIRG